MALFHRRREMRRSMMRYNSNSAVVRSSGCTPNRALQVSIQDGLKTDAHEPRREHGWVSAVVVVLTA
jgi:hypothetical protein